MPRAATIYVTSAGWLQGAEQAVRQVLEGQGHRTLTTRLASSPSTIAQVFDGVDALVAVMGTFEEMDEGDELDLASIGLEIAEAERLGLPVFVFIEGAANGGFDFHPRQAFFGSLAEVRMLTADAGADIVARPRGGRADLGLHPPAVRPEADDAGMVASEVEALLGWAERYVADEGNPDDLRREVEVRQSQLIHELELIGQGKGSSAVFTGLAAALLPIVRPGRAEVGLDAALDVVGDGVIALGEASSAEEIVAAGEATVEALDQVGEEIAEIIELNGWDDLKASLFRATGAWLEEDFRAHLNGFITLYRERLAGPSGMAGGAVVGLAGGPPWLAVTIVAAGLLRSLFPWIFPKR
ncbi:MAG TPA: hypothetical protein VF228_12515 [Iamia sp.]